MTTIMYKNADFVITFKPCGIPTQPDNSGVTDAMTLISSQLSALNEPSELFLVNRLDLVVGGLVVFARNKRASAALCDLVSKNGMVKEYFAVLEGAPSEEEAALSDYLKKDPVLSKARVSKKGVKDAKLAMLDYKLIRSVCDNGKSLSLVRINLITGRFHQIRAQFSSRGMPLVGDGKYGGSTVKAKHPALFASRLSFEYKGKKYDFSKEPPVDSYPWSLFETEINQESKR